MLKNNTLIILIGAAVALTLGIGVGLWRIEPGDTDITPDQIYAAKFADLAGKSQQLSNWKGKVLVLNFWATWCPPCREEIPDFIQADAVYRAKGVAIVGLALDEPAKVAEFAKTFGIKYPLLIGGPEAYDFAAQLGNKAKGIPFTAIIDRQGKVVYLGVGAVRKKELDKVLPPLL
ncbi:MAG: TlpA family protein disulfide reductase [Burkholderiales bacterium]|nr:TlpA family protein disulfide reductase [Burkholderiales bacterium]